MPREPFTVRERRTRIGDQPIQTTISVETSLMLWWFFGRYSNLCAASSSVSAVCAEFIWKRTTRWMSGAYHAVAV
ncbi:hypothetical protein C7419_10262 [Cupriavidus plantarum]|uniref:Uncharacterized protein n=1 Tax=Cupriavidus plantarum TaxID=942865 RepID=A0A316EUF8_9BURK|nr:hypothetical protein C7419_10262 [Cupriavidus plantarum]